MLLIIVRGTVCDDSMLQRRQALGPLDDAVTDLHLGARPFSGVSS